MGPKIKTHDIVPKTVTKPPHPRIFEFQLLCNVLLSFRKSSFHLSKLNFESNPLFPQLLSFRALLVLQALPLVHLTFEVRVAPLKFGVGALELVLLVFDAIEPQRFTFERRLQCGRLCFEVLNLFLESRDVILSKTRL